MNITKRMPIKLGMHWANHTAHDCMIELEIDEVALARLMGTRAMHNKSGRCSYMHGLIKATARRCQEEK